ncbi:hypothetical protein AK85_01055 [Streptococcus pneumoniae B1598]|nr:hypothetical protein AK85_01055 [Streptococcus pneumoniae B1598]
MTSLFAFVSALTTFFAADQAFGYGLITLLLVGLVGGFGLLLDVLLCLPILWTRYGSQSTSPFWKSVLVILASMFALVACLLGTSFLPASLNPVTGSIATSYYWSKPS